MMELSILTCCSLLAERQLKIAFAESATAGALSASFAQTPYSGTILQGSIVCYDAEVKSDLLNIPLSFILEHTPESAEVTRTMALRTKELFKKADIVVAVTGLTKSGGSETKEKPVGTVFIRFIFPGDQIQVREVFSGNSHQIIRQIIQKVADVLVEHFTKSVMV